MCKTLMICNDLNDRQSRPLPCKDTDTFAPHSAVMFASGATLGPALDGVAHGNFGVHSPKRLTSH